MKKRRAALWGVPFLNSRNYFKWKFEDRARRAQAWCPWNFSHLSLYLQDKAVKVGVQFKYLARDLNRELFFLSFSDVSRVISNTFQLWNEKICIPLIISEKLMLPCCMKTSMGAIVESSKYFPEKLQSQYWGPSFLFKCLSRAAAHRVLQKNIVS